MSNGRGIPVKGIPMPAQTVMFITNTYQEKNQNEKNIFYITPDKESEIPFGSLIFVLK